LIQQPIIWRWWWWRHIRRKHPIWGKRWRRWIQPVRAGRSYGWRRFTGRRRSKWEK
jgi:hypothetical protein